MVARCPIVECQMSHQFSMPTVFTVRPEETQSTSGPMRQQPSRRMVVIVRSPENQGDVCANVWASWGQTEASQRFSLSLNFKVYAGGGLPGDGPLLCSLLHANNQMFRSIVVRWLNVCTPDRLLSGLNIVILHVTPPIVLLCPRSLLHPPIPIAYLSHSTSTTRTDPTCIQNHLRKIAKKT